MVEMNKGGNLIKEWGERRRKDSKTTIRVYEKSRGIILCICLYTYYCVTVGGCLFWDGYAPSKNQILLKKTQC